MTTAGGWSCAWSGPIRATSIRLPYHLCNPQPWTSTSARPAWLSEILLPLQGDPDDRDFLVRNSLVDVLDKITLSIFVTRRRDASSMCLFKSVGVDDVDGLVITIHHDQAPIREPLFEANGDDYTSRAIIEPTIDLASGDVCIGFYQSGYDVFEPLEQKKALEYLENHAPWPKVE